MQPVVRLKELLDKKHWGQPAYSAESHIDGVWHTCVSITLPVQVQDKELRADGAGGTKQEARNAAAAAVLSQLEQLGVCPPADAAGTEPTTNAANSYINRLQEFLQAPGRREWRVVYSEKQRTWSPTKHSPAWELTVRLLDSNGIEHLCATGSGSSKTTAKQQAACHLLTMPEFLGVFSPNNSPTATAAAAAKAAGQQSADNAAAPATEAAAAVTFNFKAQLQELLHSAASKSLGDWAEWALPTYTHERCGPDHATQFTATAVLQGPGDRSLSAQGQPGTCKKDAEQLAAAAMLQTPQLQKLQAALHHERMRKAVSSGSLHSSGGSLSGQGGGTAMQKLNELVAQAAWCMEEPDVRQVSGPARNMPTHEASIVINGYLLAVGHGKTKGDAKAAAAQAALACMGLAPLPPSVAPAPPPMPAHAAAAAAAAATLQTQQLSAAEAPFTPTSMPSKAYSHTLPPPPPPPPPPAAAAAAAGSSALPSAHMRLSRQFATVEVPSLPALQRRSAAAAALAGSLEWSSRLPAYLPGAAAPLTTLPAAAAAVAAAGSSMNVDSPSAAAAAAPTGEQLARVVQRLSMLKFDQVVQPAVRTGVVSGANVNNTVVACYLLETPGSTELQVVALGSGTGFCAQSEQQLVLEGQRGKLLLDSHAEVIARRSLMRWLYGQAQLALQQQQQQAWASPVASVLEIVSTSSAAAAAVANQSSSCFTISGAYSGSGMLAAERYATDHVGSSSSSMSSQLLLRLKAGVKLHMYISKAPCGDACIFNRPNSSSSLHAKKTAHFSHARPRIQLTSSRASGPGMCLPSSTAIAAHWPQNCCLLNPAAAVAGCGLLRGKVLQGENCSPLPGAMRRSSSSSSSDSGSDCSMSRSSSRASLSSSSSSQQRLRKICCSDKLARWNALGLQGALLGSVLQPVYVSSITVGGDSKDFCEGAVSRAVCCRLAPHTPSPYAAPPPSHLPPTPTHSRQALQQQQQPHSGAEMSGWQYPQQQQQRHGPAVAGPHQYNLRSKSSTAMKRQQSMSAGSVQQLQAVGPNMAAAVQRGVQLPHPFQVNHPQLLHAPAAEGLPAVQAGGYGSSCCNSSRESFNWNAAEPLELEVTSGDQGTLLALLPLGQTHTPAQLLATAAVSRRGSRASRLSKRAMYAAFLQLMQQQPPHAVGYAIAHSSTAAFTSAKVGGINMLATGAVGHSDMMQATYAAGTTAGLSQAGISSSSSMSYAEAKSFNQLYTAAKACLYQHFKARTGQQWMQRKELLPDLEQFTAADLQVVSSDDGSWPGSQRSSSGAGSVQGGADERTTVLTGFGLRQVACGAGR